MLFTINFFFLITCVLLLNLCVYKIGISTCRDKDLLFEIANNSLHVLPVVILVSFIIFTYQLYYMRSCPIGPVNQ